MTPFATSSQKYQLLQFGKNLLPEYAFKQKAETKGPISWSSCQKTQKFGREKLGWCSSLADDATIRYTKATLRQKRVFFFFYFLIITHNKLLQGRQGKKHLEHLEEVKDMHDFCSTTFLCPYTVEESCPEKVPHIVGGGWPLVLPSCLACLVPK